MSKTQNLLNSGRAWVQKNPWKTGSVILVVLAFWFAMSGVGIYQQNKTERDVLAARDMAVKKIQPFSASLIEKMQSTASQFVTADSLMDSIAVKSAIANSIPNAESVQLHSVGLADAYENIEKFGAGKLAVLESASNDSQVAIRIIKVGDQRKLVLAKLIGNETQNILAYVQLPISVLDPVIPTTTPSDAFLGLRQGQVDLIQRGNVEFASTAEMNASVISGTPWRVVASSALPERGMFELGGITELGLAGLFILLAVMLPFVPSYVLKRKKGGEEDEHEGVALTLAEMQAKGTIQADDSNPAPVFNIKDIAFPKVPLVRDIFRAYDIRGIVGTNLDAGIARLIGEAIGTILIEKDLKGIVVGFDGRLSSPKLSEGLIEGLTATGVSVLNIGQVPTPVVYFATYNSEFTSGISITGSHNPPDYNGFKIMIDGHTLYGDEISNIFERIAEKRIIKSTEPGRVVIKNIVPEYTQYITNDIQIDRPLKIVVDCGNGVPGSVVPAVLRGIGAIVEEIYCEVDGNFPNHHPDPSDPDNLIDLIKTVKHTGADIGLAFDGDGDRLGVVTAQGEMIYPDRLLMLFAEDILHRNPGAAIIYDVKCTGALQGHILRHGGSPLMWKTGHSLIKAKMKETQAEFAGEMSGHFFFAERWFGFDDGIYAAARLLEILAAAPEGIQEKFDTLPKSFSTPELKVELEEGQQHSFMESFAAKANFEGARINNIDGVRADWPYGWGLVRASNTTPVLVLRFEADSELQLENIKKLFREQLLALREDLYLPF
jgi:phosphomannomutase/phosphoglucomutase